MKNLTKLLLGVFLIVILSCNKTTSDSNLNQESLLVKELGFNLNQVKILKYDNTNQGSALKFNSKNDAINYFKSYLYNFNNTYYGSLRSNLVQTKVNLLSDTVESNKNDRRVVFVLPEEMDTTVDLTNYVNVINGYNVTMNITVVGGGGTNSSGGGIYNVTDIQSGLIGVVIGVTWTQQTVSYTNYPNSSLIYVTITGLQNYNLFVNGIGTFVSQPVIINGIYNTNTGAYSLNRTTPSATPQ